MDATIEEGFYLDPETKRTFFIKKVNGNTFVPPWVKTMPSNWKKIVQRKEVKT